MNHNQNQNFQNVNNFGHHAMHSRSTCTNVIESINKLIDISSDEDAKIARIALTKVIQNHVEAFTSVLVIPGYLLAHERSRDILDNLLTVINFPGVIYKLYLLLI